MTMPGDVDRLIVGLPERFGWPELVDNAGITWVIQSYRTGIAAGRPADVQAVLRQRLLDTGAYAAECIRQLQPKLPNDTTELALWILGERLGEICALLGLDRQYFLQP